MTQMKNSASYSGCLLVPKNQSAELCHLIPKKNSRVIFYMNEFDLILYYEVVKEYQIMACRLN